MYELIKRPELDYFMLAPLDPERPEYTDDIGEQVNIIAKYEGYITSQLEQVNQFRKFEKKILITCPISHFSLVRQLISNKKNGRTLDSTAP